MRYVITDKNAWQQISDAVAYTTDGDEIVVPNTAQRELAERALARTRRADSQVTITVVAEEEEDAD